MTTQYIAIQIDEENGCEAWWDAMDENYPALADSLRRNRVAVIDVRLWDKLAALPGFADGPDMAPNPILDLGSEGEQWADAVARPHSVFDVNGD